jgi:hypothetical protein
MSLYNSKKWKNFRNECLSVNGNQCHVCGKKEHEAILQIHHPYYEQGKMPWEYDPKFCAVLCKGCHAREHGIIPPDSGWTLVYSDWENGEKSGQTNCGFCGADMEWHNVMHHPKWGEMTVGYECAERLGVPGVHKLKLKMQRMKTFLHSPKWRTTANGYSYRYAGKKVTVFKAGDFWKLVINDVFGKRTYASVLEAKKQAFLYLEVK